MLMVWLFSCLAGGSGSGDPVMRVNLDSLNMQIWPSYFHVGSRFVATPNGHILGIDPSEQSLVLLSPAGEVVRRFGGKGSGPGEFSGLDAVSWQPDGGFFLVSDRKNHRVSKWSDTGTFQEEYKVKETLRSPIFTAFDDFYFLRKRNDGTKTILSIVHAWDKGAEERVLFEVEKPYKPLNLGWDPTLVFGLNQNYLVVNHGSEPTLTLFDLKTGSQVKQIPVMLKRTPVTDAYFQDYQTKVGRRDPEMVSEITRPEYWPYVNKILVDDADRIWLFLHQEKLGKSHEFVVYDMEGNLLHRGELMGWAQCVVENKLYMVHGDEDEELFLSTYQVTF